MNANSGVVVVAHELKAPLSLVRQLALSLDLDDSPEARREISQQIVSTSERALRQVERRHGDLAVVVWSERVRAPDAVDVRLVVPMAGRAAVAAHEKVLPLGTVKIVCAR